jgi:hypothetical protein
MNSAMTNKLLGNLHNIFNKDPDAVLLFRLQSHVPFNWKIYDGVLTLGGLVEDSTVHSINLADHTIGSLIVFLRDTLGYTIEFQSSEMMGMSALVLLDGSSDSLQSNGDHLYGYKSILWSYVSSISSELNVAILSIAEMLKQMSINLASKNWLDEHGGYYKVSRNFGESDLSYSQRIIAETLRPKNNNKAIEAAIYEASGVRVNVLDATNEATEETAEQNLYEGKWTFNGSRHYSQVDMTSMRCLFDVIVNYQNIGEMSSSELMLIIRDQVNRLRAAGTYMRKISICTANKYDGNYLFDGTKQFCGVAG